MKKTNNIVQLQSVNFDKFSIQKQQVTINGKNLPLAIGDKIILSENEKNHKTIVALTIFEDGRVSYLLEWFDPDSGAFNTETATLTELKLLSKNIQNKIKNGNIGY